MGTPLRALIVEDNELQQLSRAVEQSANLVIITDLAGTIEYANSKFDTTIWTAQRDIEMWKSLQG